MPSLTENAPRHWRSLDELADTPEFRELLAREFPDTDPDRVPATTRRRFLQLMGASIALASLSSCRWEKESIVPFAKRPEGTTPGVPKHFATGFELGGYGQALLVTNYDGRPIKIEGNPEHPASRGATTPIAQALTLELCDPDRSRGVARGEGGEGGRLVDSDWSTFTKFAGPHFARLRKTGGAGLWLLCETTSSPTTADMRKRFARAFPQARFVDYEPVDRSNVTAGARRAYGRALRPHLFLREADIIVAVDDDFLGEHPDSLRHARDFAARRDPDARMNRLYAVETTFSTTGAAADHRLAIRPSEVLQWLVALERAVEAVSKGDEPRPELLSAAAAALVAKRGRSLVTVGPRAPAAAHAVAHRINERLGNVGKTIRFSAEPIDEGGLGGLAELTSAMKAGRVDTLVVLGGNPVYDAPADLDFAAAFAAVPNRLHASYYRNETSLAATWHLPRAHALESWTDLRTYDGTAIIVQPQIEPLFGGRTSAEVLALLANDPKKRGLDLVRRTWQGILAGPGFEKRWKRALHDGYVTGSASTLFRPKLQRFHVRSTPPSEGLELVLLPDSRVWDGRFANLAWLQETPDSLTKLTWDNAALLGPATAARLGVTHESVVAIEVSGRTVEAPVYVLPGQPDGVVALHLGFGRHAAGQVGGSARHRVAPVGADAFPLRTTGAPHWVRDVGVRATGGRHRLATTQDHHAIDTVGLRERERRLGDLVRETDLADYAAHPDFAKHAVHHPPLESLWTEPSQDGRKWGMTIDLNKCIGCNACMVACTSENNVPVVGKDEVLRGREMHWLRVDRYFKGEPEAPEVVHQPVTCQHCENAPCEQVCPVAATVHSDEGLNDMAYNRCIGTRYCANNCPYKVRRFNYFDYNKSLTEPGNELQQLILNPEVTVRSRGVMEKCTFCVQRIQSAKITAKNDGRELRDGEIRTACQTACPTEAVVFGDLADTKSRVHENAALPRAYQMLGELNVKPRTSFLARVRNPDPLLAKDVPAAPGAHR